MGIGEVMPASPIQSIVASDVGIRRFRIQSGGIPFGNSVKIGIFTAGYINTVSIASSFFTCFDCPIAC